MMDHVVNALIMLEWGEIWFAATKLSGHQTKILNGSSPEHEPFILLAPKFQNKTYQLLMPCRMHHRKFWHLWLAPFWTLRRGRSCMATMAASTSMSIPRNWKIERWNSSNAERPLLGFLSCKADWWTCEPLKQETLVEEPVQLWLSGCAAPCPRWRKW